MNSQPPAADARLWAPRWPWSWAPERARPPAGSSTGVVGKAMAIEPYAIMLPRDDPAFKRVADQEVRRVIASGEIGPS